jgi:ribosomal protein S18 acetylase RimI-like enzyme
MDAPDVDALARLHVACLPDSLVTVLGARYARSFYRYVTRSPREVTVIERDDAGNVVAAAVVSLEPSSLNRRLMLQTSLLPSLLLNVPALLALFRSSFGTPGDSTTSEGAPAELPRPEMILIFTAPEVRRQGRAATLVRRAEQRLVQLGIPAYQVRTVLSPSNRALDFYRDLQFAPAGTAVRFGTRFQVFTKQLAGEARADDGR